MNFDMEKLIKCPLIDSQSFYVDHIPGLDEESFADICSDDPLGNALISPTSDVFSIDSRVDEYARLMDASEEVMSVYEEKGDESAINVNRYLQNAGDRQPSSLDSYSSKKVPKVELKQLPAGLKYTFLYDNSYSVIVNANLSSGELAVLLNKLRK